MDNVKTQKAKAILQYNLLQTIQTLFRVTELCLLLILLSWTLTRLPFAVKISGNYFLLIISIIFNPGSIFFILNIIVLSLLFKSGHLEKQENEIYQEYFTSEGEDQMKVLVAVKEEIVYEDKNTIFEDIKNDKDLEHAQKEFLQVDEVRKNLMRSKSDNLERVVNTSRKLRRSETEKLHVFDNISSVEVEEKVHVFDKLSNEEFQRTIEEFIAKQMMFHKAEKVAIVLHNNQA